MKNEKGSAVAIVMLVLGVSSLVAVALLTQARLDVQLSSSAKSYDKMFSLADGGAFIAFSDLKTINRDPHVTEADQDVTIPLDIPESDRTFFGRGVYHASVTFTPKIGGKQSPEQAAGFGLGQEGGFSAFAWRAEGKGVRNAYGGVESNVHIAVYKFDLSGY
jgi:hypothetical protein